MEMEGFFFKLNYFRCPTRENLATADNMECSVFRQRQPSSTAKIICQLPRVTKH
jgi:hypothetical protein